MGRRKKHRKVRVPRFVQKTGAAVLAQFVRTWMSTLDVRAAYYDRTVDPILGIGGPRIYVFWHENILIPLYERGHCNLTMLLSLHEDAEVLSHVAQYLGFKCVRGSTYRGGAKAIWQLCERGQHEHLTLTPDGPRGPRRQLAMGPVYLASRLQLPLVPMGFGSDRPWRMNSWDRFAVPRPFSRARAVIGPPILLPRELDREQLEATRHRVERLMNDLTVEAECWAASCDRKVGEVRIKPGRAPKLIPNQNLKFSTAPVELREHAA